MALGINRDTGQPLEGFSHLLQSVRDILTTRKGSRVMRRDYGSNIPNLVDRPIDEELRVDLYIETAQALFDYEPRLRVLDVDVLSRSSGRVELSMTAEYLPNGKVVSLEGIVIR